MIIAGGVYVEKCIAPETIQLLGSAGRAALGLSGMRPSLTLHTFHPPGRWNDLRANFAPYGIEVVPHPAAERVTFSYLFPLGRPVQTPAWIPSAGQVVVEGDSILCFGCVEGSFIARGRAVVHDLQGAAGVRASGSTADRLALVLNLQEALVAARAVTAREAAARLLRNEGADVIVIKDGPRGATVFGATGEEQWIPPYASSRLYKIGSGDVFTATFAHWWLGGYASAEAADRASRQTAAYVEAPVLPLSRPIDINKPRVAKPPKSVIVAVNLSGLAGRWFAKIVEEALIHIGIAEVQSVNIDDWLTGSRSGVRSDTAVLLCPGTMRQMELALQICGSAAVRHVIFFEEPLLAIREAALPVVADLSQAIYELCWA